MRAKRIVKQLGHQMPALRCAHQAQSNELDTIIVTHEDNLHIK